MSNSYNFRLYIYRLIGLIFVSIIWLFAATQDSAGEIFSDGPYCSLEKPQICGANKLQFAFGEIIFDSELTIAQEFANKLTEKWSWYISWFEPIYSSSSVSGGPPGRDTTSIDLNSPEATPLRVFISDDTNTYINSTPDDEYAITSSEWEVFIHTNPPGWLENTYGESERTITLYHEIWHVFQKAAGLDEGNTGPDRAVAIESSAVFASTIVEGESSGDLTAARYNLYDEKGFRLGLLDENNAYGTSLFLYWLRQKYGDQVLRQVQLEYGISLSDRAAFEATLNDDDFRNFAKQLYNQSDDDQYFFRFLGHKLRVDGSRAQIPESAKSELQCQASEIGVTRPTEPQTFPPLSVRRYNIEVDGEANHCRIHLGDFKDSDFGFAYLFLKKDESDVLFEDLSEKSIFRLCFEEGGFCEEGSHQGYTDVQLIVGNDSTDQNINLDISVGNLAEKYDFRQVKLLRNHSRNSLILGDHELRLYPNGEAFLLGKRWWIQWDSKLLPQGGSSDQNRLLNWVNERCRIGGFGKYRWKIIEAEINDDEEEEITFELTLLEKGELSDSPEGWYCNFDKEISISGTYGGLPAQAAFVRTMTNMNSKDYAPNTLVGKMGIIMRYFITLGMSEGQTRELKLTHRESALGGKKMILEMPLNSKVIGFFQESVEN